MLKSYLKTILLLLLLIKLISGYYVSPDDLNKCHSFIDNFKGSRIVEAHKYNGNPKSADWINISGNKETYTLKHGLLEAHLLKPRGNRPLGHGVTLNSTYKLHYGSISITMKPHGAGGVVSAFIVKNGDEIDWECLGGDTNHAQSNYFWNGELLYGVNGGIHLIRGKPMNEDFHTYSFDWKPDRIVWKIDGRVVRTLWKKDTYVFGFYKFPTRPSYVQIGIWDGSSPGTVNWAHGPIKWSSLPDKLTTQIKQVKVTCDPKHNIIV
ncbi:3804_t:CDS:2 [Diversispora eburnea]|uniref:3804_t:CDS:1 n=1 Tax=Diversispora eburnea TaxID=1213867 RepID=A0A9N8VWB1_9GLOM|nr:3804_t:CDS:2 [Diversispora eburnea]